MLDARGKPSILLLLGNYIGTDLNEFNNAVENSVKDQTQTHKIISVVQASMVGKTKLVCSLFLTKRPGIMIRYQAISVELTNRLDALQKTIANLKDYGHIGTALTYNQYLVDLYVLSYLDFAIQLYHKYGK